MALHTIRIITVLGSVLASATALAAPKPFDAALITAPQTDEEVVMGYVINCSPPLRLCQEGPLNIDGQPGVDMFVGVNNGNPKRFYAGLNNGLFSPPTDFGVNGPTSGFKFADLDGDGDLDMVESIRANGSLVATNMLYVNTLGTLASLHFGAQPLDAAKHDRSAAVLVGDVNNDSRLDVIIINETEGTQNNPGGSTLPYGQTNYLYLNTAATTANNIVFGAALALDTPTEERYTRRGLLIDVEGDGDFDLVVTSADNHEDHEGNGNWLYVNGTVGGSPAPLPGANPFAAAIRLNVDTADDTDVANAIAAGDIDGDGDPDLVFSTWSRMNGAAAVPASNRYYINSSVPGSINFETTATFGPAANHTNIRLGDFDNDSDVDVVSLVHVPAARSRLHLNTETPGAFFDNTGLELVPPATWTVDRPRGFDFGDLNNDGSLDLVIANRDQVGLRYLNNDQCSASGCGTLSGPFANYTPSIPAPISTVTVPAGTTPIDVDTVLGTLTVTDPDNIYPADFTAVVLMPSATADYTCTLGSVASGADVVCVDGQITPTAGAASNGSIGPIQVKISDGLATSAAALVDLMITGSSPNAPPTITAPGAQTATVGQAFTLTVVATDPNNDPLAFAATGLPAGLNISAAGIISGTPTTAGAPVTVTVTVDDGRGGTDSEAVQVTVQAAAPANGAPTITAPGPQTATVGTAFSLTVVATDPNSDPLTFAATGLPAGLSISAAGVIAGTPTTAGAAVTVTVTVNDGRGGTDSEPFQLTVQAAGAANAAPTFTAPGPQSGTVGTAFSLSLASNAADANGDTLSFSATGLPPGIALSTAGVLAGSPTTATGSPFSVTVTVDDGRGGQASGTFQFTVSAAAPAPPSGGGGGSGGGGAFGFLEVLGLLGMGALATRRRSARRAPPQSGHPGGALCVR